MAYYCITSENSQKLLKVADGTDILSISLTNGHHCHQAVSKFIRASRPIVNNVNRYSMLYFLFIWPNKAFFKETNT